MPLTLAGAAVSTAVLRVPRYGVPYAEEVALVDSPALTIGGRATLTIGDLSLVGTLRPGGDFGGTARYSWIAGAGKWESAVDKRGYRDDAGVMLSAVARDLAADAGEIGLVLDVPDRLLGTAWTRPAGLASDALRALAGEAWWVAPDGMTHIGPRPARTTAAATLTIDPFDPATKRGVARLVDDAIAQLLPGVTLTARGLPAPLPVTSLVVRASPDAVDVELYGEAGLVELLTAIVAALTSGHGYHRLLPYSVAQVAQALATVRPADTRSVAFPDETFLPQIGGVPGMTAVLQVGAPVLVGFPAGDPGQPAIMLYLPGTLPASLAFSALTTISAEAPSIELGAGAVPLAKAGIVDLNLGVLVGKINTICAALSIPPLGGLSSTATTKAKGA